MIARTRAISTVISEFSVSKRSFIKLFLRTGRCHQEQNHQTSIYQTPARVSCRRAASNFTKMSSVHVKNFEQDDRLQISLDLVKEGKTKSFNLNRLKTETLSSAVERLQTNLAKKLVNKKSKKKKAKVETETGTATTTVGSLEKDESEIPVAVLHNGLAADLSLTNIDAWIDGAVLKVGDEEIPVSLNPPSAKLEKLPRVIMEDFPLYPYAEFEFVDVKECEFFWKTFPSKLLPIVSKSVSSGDIDLSDAVSGKSYTPTSSERDYHVLLACVPRSGDRVGKLDAVISSAKVSPGPGPCPFEKRFEFTNIPSQDGLFRVLSYNILAEMYADTDVARTQLFAHCPQQALDMSYRKQLILKEILGYQADLLCLQEVDRSIFRSHLNPALSSNGYTGLFRSKAGQLGEGCATFMRDSKFRLVRELDITISEYLSSHPDCVDIWTEVCKSEQLKQKVEERSSILQVTVVESVENPGSYLCVANTHLYFHPRACNVRLIQGATALRYLQSVCQTYEQEGSQVALVFCGDFNSDPLVGVYQLYTAGWVPADYQDWDSAGPEEKITGLELRQPMNIESACGTPKYTNFTPMFNECLDYVYIDADKLKVESVVPMPDHADVVANAGLPSVVFPSDHIALICDLKLKD
ncbi:2',5'-phosphodiesterase 12 [Aplysia californica]|uniref:2',5'-phosphodiesterase 12 n=1 Tax=Aplysia californica TaxID=6500 RepID=A0ABM0JCH2_APLCA|nr:2',5'-phosphodiesterase 12 [Aplysia californica]